MSLFFSAILNNDPWHWSISGLIIGLIVPALLLIGNKSFGVSSSLKHLCALAIPHKTSFFNYELKPHYWSFFLVGGVVLGGVISLLVGETTFIELGEKTNSFLEQHELSEPTALYPIDLYNFQNSKGIILILIGGFLVGFGTRWANGCTSGHSIFGISNLKLVSLYATISFFIGGLLMTHFLFRFIL